MKVFKEEQRFTQKWLVVLLVASGLYSITMITNSFLKNDMTLLEYCIITSVFIGASGMIFLFKLKTRIDETGIHYRFIPFHFSTKTILWKDIEKCYTRNYNALIEYGGWGIKSNIFSNKKRGVAYNIKGNIGIQLELKNGKKILIGTQLKHQIDKVILSYRK